MTYIIWSPQGVKPPSVVFNRRFLAEREAQRISKLHPNQVFHVCKIKSATVGGVSAYFDQWRPNEKPDGFAKMPSSAPVFNVSPLQEDYASLTFFRSPKVVRDSGV